MSEQVIIELVGESSKLDPALDKLEEFGQISAKNAKQFKADSDKLIDALVKEKGIIGGVEQALKGMRAARDKATDLKDIKALNQEIHKLETQLNKVKSSGVAASNQMSTMKSIVGNLGAALGVAFTFDKAISIIKDTSAAFLEAEQNANQLKVAVLNVAKEGVPAFEKLIDQSTELQKITIFSDDDIQKSQTELINLGLTTAEVEKLIPRVLDLAKANGISLAQATDKVIQGINGQTRGLRPLGLAFKDTGDKAQNMANIIERVDAKFKDASKSLVTNADKIAFLKNQYGEFKEFLGGEFVDTMLDIGTLFTNVSEIASNFFSNLGNPAGFALQYGINDTIKSLEKAAAEFKSKQKAIFEDNLEDARSKTDSQLKVMGEVVKENIRLLLEERTAAIKSGDAIALGLANKAIATESYLKDAILQVIQEREDKKAIIEEDGAAKREEAARKRAEALKKAQAADAKFIEDQYKRQNDEIQAFANTQTNDLARTATTPEEIAAGRIAIEQSVLEKQIALNTLYGKTTVDLEKQLAQLRLQAKEKGLEAEIKLFNERVKAAEDAGKEETENYYEELKKRREAEEENEKVRQKIKDDSLELVGDSLQFFFDTEVENNRRSLDAQLSDIESKRKAELKLAETTGANQDAINKRYDQQLKNARRKSFEEEKRLKTYEATFSLAAAVARAFADYKYPASIAIAALAGAQAGLQIIKIQSANYAAKGKEYVTGPGSKTSDSVPFMLSVGERVVDADANQQYYPTLSAIHKRQIKPQILNDFVKGKFKSGRQTVEATINSHSLARALRENNGMYITNLGELAKYMPQQNPYTR